MPFRLLALASLLVALPAAHAQAGFPIQKGSFTIGGTAGASSQSFDGNRFTSIGIAPSVLVFVADGLAIGGSVTATAFKVESAIGFDSDWDTRLGLGPRVAYYLGDSRSTVYPYAALGGQYSRPDGTLGGEAAVGALFMLSRAVGVHTEGYFSVRDVSRESVQTLGVRAGIQAFIY